MMNKFSALKQRTAVAAFAFFFCAAMGSAATITGGTTTVTLDAGTVSALTGLGFTIAPISPATLGGSPLQAVFPISGGDTTTQIDHWGGLDFTKGGVTAGIEDFIIHLSGLQANTITGNLVAGGVTVTGVELFDIGAGSSLTLAGQLASDLSAAYGIPNLAGAPIGTATVSPITSASPEPSTYALCGVGLAGALWLVRRRSGRAVSSL
jgi:hypothetical protein